MTDLRKSIRRIGEEIDPYKGDNSVTRTDQSELNKYYAGRTAQAIFGGVPTPRQRAANGRKSNGADVSVSSAIGKENGHTDNFSMRDLLPAWQSVRRLQKMWFDFTSIRFIHNPTFQ